MKKLCESGSLTLQHISTKQEGTYTCELSWAEQTYMSNITLNIQRGKINRIITCTASVPYVMMFIRSHFCSCSDKPLNEWLVVVLYREKGEPVSYNAV